MVLGGKLMVLGVPIFKHLWVVTHLIDTKFYLSGRSLGERKCSVINQGNFSSYHMFLCRFTQIMM